tara:strand:+ start:126 stop:455 length:330 start_codon:yes stop_codon:yes gene_type:complete
MFKYEVKIWDEFVKNELPRISIDLQTESPQALIDSIMALYSDFEEEMYQLAADHDPEHGQDNWQAVNLIDQVRAENDDLLRDVFRSQADCFTETEDAWQFPSVRWEKAS